MLHHSPIGAANSTVFVAVSTDFSGWMEVSHECIKTTRTSFNCGHGWRSPGANPNLSRATGLALGMGGPGSSLAMR